MVFLKPKTGCGSTTGFIKTKMRSKRSSFCMVMGSTQADMKSSAAILQGKAFQLQFMTPGVRGNQKAVKCLSTV